MPTEKHLFQNPVNPNEYTLEVDFMHAWDKSLSEDYTVRVILPEGATNIKLELPFQVTGADVTMGKYFGTLDYFGRPEIKINKLNAVHEICDGPIRVKYEFEKATFYLEVFQLAGLVFLVFLFLIIASRLELNLESKKVKQN